MSHVKTKKAYRFLFFLILCYWASPTTAQNLAGHLWYFGNGSSGIQFNRPNYSPALAPKPAIASYGVGGGAVASDPISGDLLFYTDGQNVYDINHALMANGSGLDGDNARKSGCSYL